MFTGTPRQGYGCLMVPLAPWGKCKPVSGSVQPVPIPRSVVRNGRRIRRALRVEEVGAGDVPGA